MKLRTYPEFWHEVKRHQPLKKVTCIPCVCFLACSHVHQMHTVPLRPEDGNRAPGTGVNWSHRELWDTQYVLGTEAMSSARATCALNNWDNLPCYTVRSRRVIFVSTGRSKNSIANKTSTGRQMHKGGAQQAEHFLFLRASIPTFASTLCVHGSI